MTLLELNRTELNKETDTGFKQILGKPNLFGRENEGK